MDWIWYFMLAIVLFVPLIIFILGAVFCKYQPKNINYVLGYRTKRSMLSDETWRFANKLMGKIWVVLGAVLLAVSAAVYAGCINLCKVNPELTHILSCSILGAQVLSMFLSIIPVEKALKKNFDEKGHKKVLDS